MTLDDNTQMIWTGQCFVDARACQVCFQPECDLSGPVERPRPGAIPSRLEQGEREYRGYCEWAVHPDEARFILHRGYAIVNGERAKVLFVQNEAFVTQLRVDGSDSAYVLEETFLLPSSTPSTVKEIA